MQLDPVNPQVRKVNLSVMPEQLYLLGRGFSGIFWGILLGLTLASGMISIRVFSRIPVPAYLIGIVVVFWGLLKLSRVGPLTPLWPARIHRALFCVFLQVYLSPFVLWWQKLPDIIYYIANTAVFFLCTIWLLVLINRLAGEVASVLHDSTFYIEARLSAWSALIFTIGPAAIVVAFFLLAGYGQETGFYFESISVQPRVYGWLYVFMLLPFTLTMAVSWKAKERCFTALKWSAKPPVSAGVPQD